MEGDSAIGQRNASPWRGPSEWQGRAEVRGVSVRYWACSCYYEIASFLAMTGVK